MQTRVISFDLKVPQMLLRILFFMLYSCCFLKKKGYILVDWRTNLLIEHLAIKTVKGEIELMSVQQ